MRQSRSHKLPSAADSPLLVPETAAVPNSFRGVWQRSLLRTPTLEDTGTTVFWMQTSRWHADIRVPADRPDFSGVQSLDECSEAQLQWLSSQQGFSGVTRVDPLSLNTAWLRLVDFQPASALPDEGHARFESGILIETGIHDDYLEHWHLLAGSQEGAAVFRDRESERPQYLLMAGQYVMQVKPRALPWLNGTWGQGPTLREQLAFEISFYQRNNAGWRVQHSTLPWIEGSQITIELLGREANQVELAVDGSSSHWEVLEWTPPWVGTHG